MALQPNEIVQKIQNDPSWSFVLQQSWFEIPRLRDLSDTLREFKKYFPTADSVMKIINNHALAHYDSQVVDSYREPVEMIYAERFEELLMRDLEMPFRMTYASEHLGDYAICTYLSYIYAAHKRRAPETLDRWQLKSALS